MDSLIFETLPVWTLVYCRFKFSRQVIGDLFSTTFDLSCSAFGFETWCLDEPEALLLPFSFFALSKSVVLPIVWRKRLENCPQWSADRA